MQRTELVSGTIQVLCAHNNEHVFHHLRDTSSVLLYGNNDQSQDATKSRDRAGQLNRRERFWIGWDVTWHANTWRTASICVHTAGRACTRAFWCVCTQHR